MRRITVSVVSHGHGAALGRLLRQLHDRHGGWVTRVVVTYNLSASLDPPVIAPPPGWSFDLVELRNLRPLGFGANHNRAFAHCGTELFCVLNPDTELPDDSIWPWLAEAAGRPGVGCAYPVLLNSDGSLQDNEREAVTPASLWRRHLHRRAQMRVDWVSAAFWLLPAAVYRSLGGFNEAYFMYCEDTDFCLRLRLAGWQLAKVQARAIHHAGYGSRADARHFSWHVRSLLRLWRSPVLRRFLTSLPR